MALIDEVERRAELAVKVSMLEERSIQNQKQLDRIEAALIAHSAEEEGMLSDINKSLIEFTAEIQEKIIETITPIKDDVQKYKTIIGVVGTVLSAIGGLIIAFHEQIIKFFTH